MLVHFCVQAVPFAQVNSKQCNLSTTCIENLYLSWNQINGTLPTEFGNMIVLSMLMIFFLLRNLYRHSKFLTLQFLRYRCIGVIKQQNKGKYTN